MVPPIINGQSIAPNLDTSPVKLKFPDVSSTHWANRHIAKLSAQQIIVGDSYGLFSPEQFVSQQDAVIIAVRMMGLQSEVDAIQNSRPLPDFLTVGSYALNYVLIAIEYGLIVLDEEKVSIGSAGRTWGTRFASRDWITRIFIRAINQEQLAGSLSNSAPSFTDINALQTQSWGYINAAKKLQLITGYPDGSFKPQQPVTRAQIATIMSRGQKYTDQFPARAVKGTLTNLSFRNITIENSSGVTSTFIIHPDAYFYGNKSDVKINLLEIPLLVEVFVVQHENIVYYIEITNDQTGYDIFDGYLQALNSETLNVDIQKNGILNTYTLSPNLIITDTNGRGLSFSSLNRGAYFEFKKSKLSNNSLIIEMVLLQAPLQKTFKGKVQQIDLSGNTLKLLDESNNLAVFFPISKKIRITNVDAQIIDWTEIDIGDQFNVEIIDSEITKMVLLQKSKKVLSIQGKMILVNRATKVITVEIESRKLISYYIDPACKVTFGDLLELQLEDIRYMDEVRLEITDEQVTRITIIK